MIYAVLWALAAFGMALGALVIIVLLFAPNDERRP
jgi:uncharacterized protein involved in outer membrane biogenesis